MIVKQVKEYSKRQRIDLNKSDKLTTGADVYILTENEYNKYKEMENKFIALETEIQILQKQEHNLKDIIENVTAPIYKNHEKELKNKDNQIKELETQLKLCNSRNYQFNIDLQGLNLIDFVIFRKHKKLIKNYNEILTANNDDPIYADVKKLD